MTRLLSLVSVLSNLVCVSTEVSGSLVCSWTSLHIGVHVCSERALEILVTYGFELPRTTSAYTRTNPKAEHKEGF